jgi:8-oxo-dGTP pyrophosphatase MutT (NUDIX family)
VCHRFRVTGVNRRSAKVLLLDPDGRVLLFKGVDPAQPSQAAIWFPVGGGIDQGETVEEAAVREVKEETGLLVSDLGPVVMTRHVNFTFDGDSYDQYETYFAVQTGAFVPDPGGWTETEQRVTVRSRWWSLDDLRTTEETVYPERLAGLIERLLGGYTRSARPNVLETGAELTSEKFSPMDT